MDRRERTPPTLLVVEDEDAVRELMAAWLRRAGYVVVTASGAVEARDRAARHLDALDVVIADLELPDADGRALVAELRARRPNLGALFVSGYPEPPAPPAGGRTAFLQKPFTAADLRQAVDRLLDVPDPPRPA